MSKNILLVLLCAVILSFNSFYNRFPLLTVDSGTYLDAGFKKTVPEGATAIYGLFIAHTSWGFSIWLVILSQAFMLSLVIYYYFRYFSGGAKGQVYYLAFVFFITFFTAASVSVSTIGTGMFSCICFLATGLLLFAEKLMRRDAYIISVIAAISIGISIVNLATIVLVLLVFSLGLIGKRAITRPNIIKTNWRRIGLTSIVVLVSWLLVSGLHYALENNFVFAEVNKFTALQAQNYKGNSSDFLLKTFSDKLKFSIADYPRNIKNSETFSSLSMWFNWELREGCLSNQYFRGLTFTALSYTQIITCIVSVLVFIYLAVIGALKKYHTLFIFSITFFLIFLITACFLNVEKTSLSWQIIWLLLLPVFVSLTGYEKNNTKQLS